MRGREKFVPKVGAVYENHGGGKFRCLRSYGYNADMQNVKSGWTFLAHVCRMYDTGKIDWEWSSGGRFLEVPK